MTVDESLKLKGGGGVVFSPEGVKVVAKRRARHHCAEIRSTIKRHHSVLVEYKGLDMAAMGVLDLHDPTAGWQVDLQGAGEDVPFGPSIGGASGVMDIVAVRRKAAGASFVLFQADTTAEEQRAIDAWGPRSLNTLGVASLGPDSVESGAAGYEGVVQQGLLSVKGVKTSAQARQLLRPSLQKLLRAWGAAAAAAAPGPAAAAVDARERDDMMEGINVLRRCKKQSDVEDEEMRAELAAQASFATLACYRSKAAEVGLQGQEFKFRLGGFHKEDVAGVRTAAEVEKKYKDTTRLGQRNGADKQKAQPATVDAYASAFSHNQAVAGTSGGAKNNQKKGNHSMLHAWVVPSLDYVNKCRAAGNNESSIQLLAPFVTGVSNPTRGPDKKTGEYKSLTSAKCRGLANILNNAGCTNNNGGAFDKDATLGTVFRADVTTPGWLSGWGVDITGGKQLFIVQAPRGAKHPKRNEWHANGWEDRSRQQWQQLAGAPVLPPESQAVLRTLERFEAMADSNADTRLMPSSATSTRGQAYAAGLAVRAADQQRPN